MTSFFPDVNVWLALTYEHHAHHESAAQWLEGTEQSVFFCRLTQLGLLRLLTNETLMAEDVLTQRKAWQAYRRWLDDERVSVHDEPDSARLESTFEELSTRSRRSTKRWTDAYLAAFARTAGLTLVTFDRALRTMPSVTVELLA